MRQFIDAGLTEKSAHGSDARIVLNLEYGPTDFVKMFNFPNAFFRIHNHGSEFVDIETPFVKTQPLLDEEYRSCGSYLNQGCGYEQHWGKQYQHRERNQNVEPTLDGSRPPVQPWRVMSDKWMTVKHLGTSLRRFQIEDIEQAHDDALFLA